MSVRDISLGSTETLVRVGHHRRKSMNPFLSPAEKNDPAGKRTQDKRGVFVNSSNMFQQRSDAVPNSGAPQQVTLVQQPVKSLFGVDPFAPAPPGHVTNSVAKNSWNLQNASQPTTTLGSNSVTDPFATATITWTSSAGPSAAALPAEAQQSWVPEPITKPTVGISSGAPTWPNVKGSVEMQAWPTPSQPVKQQPFAWPSASAVAWPAAPAAVIWQNQNPTKDPQKNSKPVTKRSGHGQGKSVLDTGGNKNSDEIGKAEIHVQSNGTPSGFRGTANVLKRLASNTPARPTDSQNAATKPSGSDPQPDPHASQLAPSEAGRPRSRSRSRPRVQPSPELNAPNNGKEHAPEPDIARSSVVAGDGWRTGQKVELSDAVDFRGTCQDMCPPMERETRKEISVFESDFQAPEWTDFSSSAPAMVKKYQRAAAASEEQPPENVRPPPILEKTVDFLLTEILPIFNHPFHEVYNYIADRTRCVRQDLTLQASYDDHHTVSTVEKITRFHIVSHHRLCGQNDVFDEKLNYEMLDNCLITLFEIYEARRQLRLPSTNEAEFTAYYMLRFSSSHDRNRLLSGLPKHILESKEMRFARLVLSAISEPLVNYALFFQLVRVAPFMTSCLMEMKFGLIRPHALAMLNFSMGTLRHPGSMPLDELAELLGFSSAIEAGNYLTALGLTVKEGSAAAASNDDADHVDNDAGSCVFKSREFDPGRAPKLQSDAMIDSKLASGVTLSDIVLHASLPAEPPLNVVSPIGIVKSPMIQSVSLPASSPPRFLIGPKSPGTSTEMQDVSLVLSEFPTQPLCVTPHQAVVATYVEPIEKVLLVESSNSPQGPMKTDSRSENERQKILQENFTDTPAHQPVETHFDNDPVDETTTTEITQTLVDPPVTAAESLIQFQPPVAAEEPPTNSAFVWQDLPKDQLRKRPLEPSSSSPGFDSFSDIIRSNASPSATLRMIDGDGSSGLGIASSSPLDGRGSVAKTTGNRTPVVLSKRRKRGSAILDPLRALRLSQSVPVRQKKPMADPAIHQSAEEKHTEHHQISRIGVAFGVVAIERACEAWTRVAALATRSARSTIVYYTAVESVQRSWDTLSKELESSGEVQLCLIARQKLQLPDFENVTTEESARAYLLNFAILTFRGGHRGVVPPGNGLTFQQFCHGLGFVLPSFVYSALGGYASAEIVLPSRQIGPTVPHVVLLGSVLI